MSASDVPAGGRVWGSTPRGEGSAMRDMPYQPFLFDPGPDPVTHYFYATTNSLVVKVGMAKNTEKRMKRDRQFKGHVLIWRISCNCTPHLVGGHRKCERELRWENAHAADRLPASEHYRPSDFIMQALRWPARGDERAAAVLDWLEHHRWGQTG